jgi:hypothetical protein
MTDESVPTNLVKLQVRRQQLGGVNLSDISEDEIMISNLPLLFANGYPTCLEKFTLVSVYMLLLHRACCHLPLHFTSKSLDADNSLLIKSEGL